MNSHVREFLTDLSPELGNNAKEILESIDTNVTVLVLEKGERTRCKLALRTIRDGEAEQDEGD